MQGVWCAVTLRHFAILIFIGALAVVTLSFGDSEYLVVLFCVATIGSITVWQLNSSALLGSLAFLLPIVTTVGWTAPRGDQDGLWLLWFPTVLLFLPAMALLVVLLKRFGSRRYDERNHG